MSPSRSNDIAEHLRRIRQLLQTGDTTKALAELDALYARCPVDDVRELRAALRAAVRPPR